jgi:hypothetical protein
MSTAQPFLRDRLKGRLGVRLDAVTHHRTT